MKPKSEITKVIADLTLQANPDLATRLEYQEEALRESKCTNPVIGQWIDGNDVKCLLATFDLNDKDFAAKFPDIAHIAEPVRQRFIATIEAHFEQCQHCSLKRGYDLELDAHIKQTCQDNRQALLGLVQESGRESAAQEAEQQSANSALKASSAKG